MRKIKNICTRCVLLLLFMLPFFTILSSAGVQDVHIQETGENWIKKIKLKKNARVNGFKINVRSGVSYFEAVKVTDPGTKKLVEGEQQLEYQCKESNEINTITLTFSEGNSASIPVSCLDVIRAELIIMK